MIISLTANTTLDLTLFMPQWQWNKTIRATDYIYSMGGKPTDASWILGELGIPSRALGFAAGNNGQKVAAMLREQGVIVEFIEVKGETRVCVNVVVGGDTGQTTITTVMMEVLPEHLDQLRQQYRQALDTASVVVLGGTLPKGLSPEFYSEFIGMAKARHIPVVFDAAEPNLSAGLAAKPDYIKPNQDELSGLAGCEVVTLDDAYRAGRDVIERYGVSPIITLGAMGGLAVLPDKAYFIPTLKVPVASATGAGDAVLAGITASVAQRRPIEDGLRLGFAAAAAVVMMPGTAQCRREDVERLLPQVELCPYPAE